MRSVHVTVEGEVQGVGYRYTLRATATRAEVSGWVRNRVDGSVEAVVAGEDAAVDAVLAWMVGGPPGARVDAVRTSETPADSTPAGTGFEVRATA